jgi:urease accessory protein
MPRILFYLALTAAAMAPGVALAHDGGGAGHLHGFLHPLGGLDHLLAMVTVGVVAWQLGGRAVWAVPATFVLVMAAGGALGMAGVTLPLVETGIALSVVLLGAVAALGLRLPVVAAMAMIGVFAVFHGHAHGTELPSDASGLTYALGFMAATALLHATGIGAAAAVARANEQHGRLACRVAGAAVAVAGLALLVVQQV